MALKRAISGAAWCGLRTVALCVSLVSGLALGAHVWVSSGGLPLGPFIPAIEAQLTERTGTAVTLGSGHLARDGDGAGGPITLILGKVAADGQGRTLVLPDLRLDLMTGDVMRGQIVPRHVATRGARVGVVRTEQGLELAGGEGALDLARLAHAAGEQGFEGITIEDATFSYRSVVSGAAFEARGARVEVWPVAGGYEAMARLPLGGGIATATASIGAQTRAQLTLNGVPASLLNDLVPEVPLRAEGSLLSGAVTLTDLAAGGEARFDLNLSAGTLRAGTRTLKLVTAAWSGDFDLAERFLTLNEVALDLGDSGGVLRGTIDLAGPPAFDLMATDLVLALPIYDAPLVFRDAALRGQFAQRTLTLDDVAVVTGTRAKLSGNLALDFAGGTPGVTGTLAADEALTISDLRTLWPDRLAPLTKRWVSNNVEGGTLGTLTIEAAIPSGFGGADRRLETDMLDARFSLSDASVTYLSGMPPSVGATAIGRLTGTTFELDARGGTVGSAVVERATFLQPKLGPQRTPVVIEASLSGEAQALLAIVDSPPLNYLSRIGRTPDDFAGEGRFGFTLRRPLGEGVRPDEIEFRGEGAFANLGLTGLPAGIELSGGRGTVAIDADALTVTGDAAVLGIQSSGTLTRFFPEDGEAPRVVLEAKTTLTPRDADALGLPLRRFARGEAPATLKMAGHGRFETATFSADLTDTVLRLPALGLDKRSGSYGAFDARFVLPDEGGRLVADGFKLATPDVLIEGSARWDEAGGLARIELPRVFSDGVADLSLDLRRGADGILLDATGRHADVNGLVERLLGSDREAGGASGGQGGNDRSAPRLPVRFNAALDRVTARGGATLTGFSAAGVYDGLSLRELSLAAGLGDDGRVSFEVTPDGGGVGRDVRLATDRSGALLTALFGIDSVSGGAARLDATAIAGGPVTGRFGAEDLILRDAPLVARLLSVGSLDGLAGVLNGEGLAFDKLSGALTLEDGILTLADARMTGSALGLSANGDVDLTARQFDISGAVAPAYGVNSFLGAIPLIGDLFVSREGEGVVAFAYGVEGPIAEPTVSVNTLSALAPGVFRRMFEPIRPEKRSPEELLEAATEAAAMREDRDTARDAEQLAAEQRAMEKARGDDASPASKSGRGDKR